MPLFTCVHKPCRISLRWGEAAICPLHKSALTPREDSSLAVDWATGCAPHAKKKAFKNTTFRLTSFMPATQRGLFDLGMSGAGPQISITVLVYPTFTMPTLDIDKVPQMLREGFAKLKPWTADKQLKWKNEQQAAIDGIWNASPFRLRLSRPGWGVIDYKPQFNLRFTANPRDAHIIADIEKAPPIIPEMFNCGGSRLNLAQIISGNPKAVSSAALNSQSGRPVGMNSSLLGIKMDEVVVQYNIVAHEYGHMIGLPDEYNAGGEIKKDGDLRSNAYAIHCSATNKLALSAGQQWEWNKRTMSLMSIGNELRARHLITIWEAVTVATANFTKPQDWTIV